MVRYNGDELASSLCVNHTFILCVQLKTKQTNKTKQNQKKQ